MASPRTVSRVWRVVRVSVRLTPRSLSLRWKSRVSDLAESVRRMSRLAKVYQQFRRRVNPRLFRKARFSVPIRKLGSKSASDSRQTEWRKPFRRRR